MTPKPLGIVDRSSDVSTYIRQGRSRRMDGPSGFKNVKGGQWKFPFQLRVGATGLGLGFGCGVGIGFGSPLNLRGIPGLGQIVSSISNSLGSLNTAAGGLGTKVRMQVRGQGIKGLDVGAGCGLGLGYGFGIGLMLRPDVLEGMSRAVQHHAGKMMKSLPPQLQHLALPGQQNMPPGQLYSLPDQQYAALPGQPYTMPGQQSAALPGQPYSRPGQQGMLPGQQYSVPDQHHPFQSSSTQSLSGNSTPSSALTHGSVPHPPESGNVWRGDSSGAEGILQRSRDESSSVDGALLKEMSRSLLEQQSQLRELQKENLELKKAVCKLDKKAPFCRVG